MIACYFPTTGKYTQEDNDEITKSTDAAFINDQGSKMNCGAQPTGFAISKTSAAVVFELFIKGSKTKASYAGPQGGGPVVHLNTCRNGKKDGAETDKDCGGDCAAEGYEFRAQCEPNQKCVINRYMFFFSFFLFSVLLRCFLGTDTRLGGVHLLYDLLCVICS